MLFEHWIFRYTFCFTIFRISLPKETILSIYKKYKQELNISFNFYIADYYYKTNRCEERTELFLRDYCMDILSNYHK